MNDCRALLAMVEPRRRKGGKEYERKDCGASLAIEMATNAHELTRMIAALRWQLSWQRIHTN